MKNAVVLMFDSLQLTYLGCYGNAWIKTPHMDRLAREGVLFENCYIEGVPTVPCRRAMHTGRHTLPSGGWRALGMEDTTIADLCWGRPIDTALIFDCPMYRLPKFGYTRGFDNVYFIHGHEADDGFYEHDPLLHRQPGDYVEEASARAYAARAGVAAAGANQAEMANYLKQRQYWRGKEDRYVARTVAQAIRYLEQADRNKQFFLWIDSFDPHEPWDPPSVYLGFPCPYDPDYQGKDEFLPFAELVKGIYTEDQLHHIRMLYAELVSLCDECLGALMDAMRRLGLEENTLFMMVSDHGEPMGHAEHGHGIMRKCRPWPYEELVHAPMILRAPGVRAGQRVRSFVQSCDVAPTVCDWLGIGAHPAMQGKSLLPLARGETDKVRDFAVAGYHGYSWALYTENWAFIHWLKDAQDPLMGPLMGLDFYAGEIDDAHLRAVGGKGFMDGAMDALRAAGQTAGSAAGAERGRKNAPAVNGEGEQWTCTPGSKAQVPEQDELYDRQADPFQLVNVIDKHPTVAEDLYLTLREYMDELRQS